MHGAGVDEPLTWYEGAGLSDRRWLHGDHQGSVVATSDGAGDGTLYAYGAYGEPAYDNWSGSRFRYTGQIMLPEAKLYHYKARVYDPLLGRFLQSDTVGYADDLNLYAYVGNDPLDKTDPTGEVCDKDGTLCTADTPAKDPGKNVANTPATDKAMHDNAGQVRVGSSATQEKVGFISKDKDGDLTFRDPADAKTGSTSTQDNAKAGIAPGDVAVLHSHIPGRDEGMQDDTSHGRSLGDAQPLGKGLTNGTVMGDRLGVHEIVNGQVQFRMIDGKMTFQEKRDMQQNLNDQQKLLQP